ncbi:glycosyltransferase family 2 protein [Trichlorobacter lovleyi]|uniref:glycosyltransferase family 2 protein n=1 Tax=Trichlorobacter lovleyi TaxID=313985 RepID=UPI0023F15829|nr:glycosyltransferase family 2 protein [Trichlorobacter lovleyi]
MNSSTTHTPTTSLITVCRNSASTITATIESVLAQKNRGVEYIIVDGASTDGTQDIIKSYPDIDTFISEPDQGIADAFNKGIQLAHGDIIGLINADDQLCPEALTTVRSFFSEHPDVDVIHGDVLLCNGGRVLKRVRPAGCWWYPWRMVLFNHPATFVRRCVYDNYGLFDTTYRIAMDVEMFLRWRSRKIRILYLPVVLVNMKYGGVSTQFAEAGFREARRAFLNYRYLSLVVNLQFAGKLLLNRIIATR